MNNKFWNDYTEFKGATSFPMEILQSYAEGKILDLGCGDGTHVGLLIRMAGKPVEMYGIDPSDNIIAVAQKRFPEAKFQAGSAYQLPYAENFFDLVYAIDVIEHLHEPKKMLAEVRRVLKPDGIMIIQTPNYPIKRFYDYYNYFTKRNWRTSPADDRTHFYKFNAWHLKKMCSEFFTVVDFMTRNILGENRVKFLKKIKKNIFGIFLGQKTIIILKK